MFLFTPQRSRLSKGKWSDFGVKVNKRGSLGINQLGLWVLVHTIDNQPYVCAKTLQLTTE